jgi:eukaryotic-like serine/threonine-protein kinase
MLSEAKRLRTGHFARTAGELIEPFHDRIREVAAAGLSAERRQHYYRRLADAFEAVDSDDWDSLLHFHRQAGNRARAAHFAGKAAERARQTFSFAHAARLIDLWLELGDHDSPSRCARLVERGQVLAAAGQSLSAAESYEQAASLSDGVQATELRRHAAQLLLQSGYFDRGEALLTQVMHAARMSLPRTPWRSALPTLYWRWRLNRRGLTYRLRPAGDVSLSDRLLTDICGTITTGFGIVEPGRAAAFGARYLLHALDLGEPWRILLAAAGAAKVASNYGPEGERRALAILDMCDRLVAELGNDPRMLLFAKGSRGVTAFSLANFDECHQLCEQTLVEVEEIGASDLHAEHPLHFELATVAVVSALALLAQQDFARLATLMPPRITDAVERRDVYGATMLRLFGGSALHLARGDAEGSHREADEAMAPWSQRPMCAPRLVGLFRHIEADCYQGEGIRAFRRCREAKPELDRSLMLRARLARGTWRFRYGQALLAASVEDRAGQNQLLREADRVGAALIREGERRHRAHGLLLRATVAARRGRTDDAVTGLRAAAAGYRELTIYGFGAAVERRLGLLIGGSEGQSLTAAADNTLRRLGVKAPEAMANAWAPGFVT